MPSQTKGPHHLVELRVRDLGVIDDVTITFDRGMTALTGETGAGKTLLIEALGLLLGGRPDTDMVRAGATEAIVEGRFVQTIADVGPSAEEAAGASGEEAEITLARSVAAAGRSKAWVDGRMVPIAVLAEAGAELVELHGQHQHRSLVEAGAQRAALDAYGQIDLSELKRLRARLATLRAESSTLGGDARQRAREIDLLRYQIDEIRDARIEDGEEDVRLAIIEDRLADASAHREAAAAALDVLSAATDGSALDRMADVSGFLAGHEGLAHLDGRVRTVMAELADLSGELRTVVETWGDDPVRLGEIRSRRQRLHELQRKYGVTLDDVMAFGHDAETQVAAFEAADERARSIDREIDVVSLDLEKVEATVAGARRDTAPRLAANIESRLRSLAMPSARFDVAVDGTGPADHVSFLLGANPGEPLQPLAKVASGGELARTMLAVRLALTAAPGVLVFDEVDAGIGGSAASAVGAALAALGTRAQVLVVTHLAQVAANATSQVAVRKSERDGRTVSDVVMLDPDDRVIELSRMLAGRPDSESARDHARELLAGAPRNQ